jgi:hypothetical protein
MGWSRVQSVASVTGFGSATATYTTNLTAGSKLIAVCGAQDSGFTTTSVKDGAGNSFTKLASQGMGGTRGELSVWAIDTPSGDVGTKPVITMTASGGTNSVVEIQEVTGLVVGNTTAMLDGTPGTSSGTLGHSGSTTNPTYASTSAGEYLFTALGVGGNVYGSPPVNLTGDPNNVLDGSTGDVQVGIAYGNSTGGTESAVWVNPLSSTSDNYAEILLAFRPGSPSLAVTAGDVTGPATEVFLQVLVLTGASEAGGANVGFLAATSSITPNHSNSFIAWGQVNVNATTIPTPAASNTAYSSAAGSEGEGFLAAHYSGTVTGGTPVTVGGNISSCESAAYEVPSNGGGVPAIDASTPSHVLPNRTTTATTASFTPPAGAVLVAVLLAYDTAASPVPYISDTEGLTWTQRAFENAFSESMVVIWTATTPGGGSSAASIRGAHARFSPSHLTRYRHGHFGPVPRQPAAAPAIAVSQQHTTTLAAVTVTSGGVANFISRIITAALTVLGVTGRQTRQGPLSVAVGVSGGALTPRHRLAALTAQLTAAVAALRVPGRALGASTAVYGAAQRTAGRVVAVAATATSSSARVAGRGVSVTLAAAGGASRGVGRPLSATVSSTGSVVRTAARVTVTAVSVAGAATRAAIRTLAGVTAASPTIVMLKFKQVTLAAVAAVTGSAQRLLGRALLGEPAVAGAAQRATARTLGGVTATSAGVALLKFKQVTLTAVAAAASSAQRLAGRALLGESAVAGAVQRASARTVAGSAAAAGGVVRSATRTLTGSIAAVGAVTLLKFKQVTLTAVVAAGGVVTRLAARTVPATAAVTGMTARAASRVVTGALAVSGSAGRVCGKTTGVVVAATGAQTRNLGWVVSAPAAAAATAARRAARVCSAAALASAGVTRGALKNVIVPVVVSAAVTVGGAITHFVVVAGEFAVAAMTRSSVLKYMAGQVAATAAVTRNISRAVKYAVSITAATLRAASRSLMTAIAGVASVGAVKAYMVILRGVVVFSGAVTRKVLPNIVSVVIIGSAAARSVSRAIQGTFAVAGQTLRQAGRVLPTVIAAAVTAGKLPGKLLNASTAAVGVATRRSGKFISVVMPVVVSFTSRASHFLVFTVKTVLGVSFAAGRRFPVVLTAALSSAGSVVSGVVKSTREIAVKFGIAGTRWVTSSVTRRWRTPND